MYNVLITEGQQFVEARVGMGLDMFGWIVGVVVLMVSHNLPAACHIPRHSHSFHSSKWASSYWLKTWFNLIEVGNPAIWATTEKSWKIHGNHRFFSHVACQILPPLAVSRHLADPPLGSRDEDLATETRGTGSVFLGRHSCVVKPWCLWAKL
jgi:phospholipase C